MLNSNYKDPVNIGNPNEITILQLIDHIKKISKKNCSISYKKLPINDPKRRKPDISIAKKILDWEPKTPIEIGLLKTYNYYIEKKNE